MNLCLCLTWMQTVHIESSCVYPLIRDFMVVGFIWASCRCHILDSEIVRDFQVDSGLAVEGALSTAETGGFIDAIIGVSEDSIVGSVVDSAFIGSVISTLESELSVFLCFPFSVVDRSAVVGTMIYLPLISFPARFNEDGEVMEHFPFLNMVVCPPKSNWLIDRRESQNVGVWRAST